MNLSQIVQVTIVFENCDYMTFKGDDLRKLNFKTSKMKNYVTSENISIEEIKTLNVSIFEIVIDKIKNNIFRPDYQLKKPISVFDRITASQDIAYIRITFNENKQTKDYIINPPCLWLGNKNMFQVNKLSNNGHLHIMITNNPFKRLIHRLFHKEDF